MKEDSKAFSHSYFPSNCVTNNKLKRMVQVKFRAACSLLEMQNKATVLLIKTFGKIQRHFSGDVLCSLYSKTCTNMTFTERQPKKHFPASLTKKTGISVCTHED